MKQRFFAQQTSPGADMDCSNATDGEKDRHFVDRKVTDAAEKAVMRVAGLNI